MKKKIILLPLLALMLSACSGLDLPSRNNNQEPESREKSSIDYNELAVKVLNYISVFPEVGDKVDLSEYIDIDPGVGYKLSDYTFTSSNQQVIAINGYNAECKAQGYAEVSVAGPGITRETSVSFYVGSIAGTYVPDSRSLADTVSITIGEMNAADRTCPITVKVNAGTVGKKTYTSYEATGSYVKTGLPVLMIDFDANSPRDFAPLSEYLAYLGLADIEGFEIGSNVYGLLSADEDGVCIKTIFSGSTQEFYQAK